MFRKLKGKQKNRILLIGSFILFWAVYSFAVRNTIDVYNESNALREQLDSAVDAPARLAGLKQELKQLEAIASSKDTSAALHERLLGIVTDYCQENKMTLRDFASPVCFHQQEWTVETHPVTVEGSFISLLKLVHKLEQSKMGKVVSVDFHSRRDNKTQALSLTVTIYVQNIIRS